MVIDEPTVIEDQAPALCVVLCNVPPGDAERIARALVEQRLAACVNAIPGVVSFYRWEGALQRDAETTLLIKTRRDAVPRLTAAIRGIHPYSVPEVIALPIVPGLGNGDYHAWVAAETLSAAEQA